MFEAAGGDVRRGDGGGGAREGRGGWVGGAHGGLEPGGRPASYPPGAGAAAAVRAQQHARRQLLHEGQELVAGRRHQHGLERYLHTYIHTLV